jgi:hypothetical protein
MIQAEAGDPAVADAVQLGWGHKIQIEVHKDADITADILLFYGSLSFRDLAPTRPPSSACLTPVSCSLSGSHPAPTTVTF